MTGPEAMKRKAEARYEKLAPDVACLYILDGYGHKAIAKKLGLPARLVRNVLIHWKLYEPGKLRNGKMHRAQVGEHSRLPVAEVERRKKVKEEKKAARLAASVAAKEARALRAKLPRTPEERAKVRAYAKWKYHNDPAFRLYQLLRQRMKKVIKRGQKKGSSLKLLGCTAAHARAHIEALFVQGMNWGNSGTGPGLWHIDHIRPCASFNLTKREDQLACFHYTNLQPLWSVDNMRKGDKWII